MPLIHKEITFTIGRRWFRFYLGSTGKPQRFRCWCAYGGRHSIRRGMYLRLYDEQVIGYQRTTYAEGHLPHG